MRTAITWILIGITLLFFLATIDRAWGEMPTSLEYSIDGKHWIPHTESEALPLCKYVRVCTGFGCRIYGFDDYGERVDIENPKKDPQPKQKCRWEYTMIWNSRSADLVGSINKHMKEGWEFISEDWWKNIPSGIWLRRQVCEEE